MVADLASFAEAARHMRISPTAASRAVASLEASLGTAPLRRSPRCGVSWSPVPPISPHAACRQTSPRCTTMT
ncbi:MAG: LysR family transcriptional regulator [Sphingomonas sp.]|uniref:helix-turn-helix domain-containing protein n=1 Tax=Sphingomonas sp. TaxID=28214 RepID=UPI0035670A3A